MTIQFELLGRADWPSRLVVLRRADAPSPPKLGVLLGPPHNRRLIGLADHLRDARDRGDAAPLDPAAG